jgi:RHS repeat-associated protein
MYEPSESSHQSVFRALETEGALSATMARYYQPSIGRFISEDPAIETWNFYLYSKNDPVNRRDPYGFKSCTDQIPKDIEMFLERYRNWYNSTVKMWGPINSILLSCSFQPNSRWGGGGCGVRATSLLAALRPDTECCRPKYASEFTFGIETHAYVEIECRPCTETDQYFKVAKFDPWKSFGPPNPNPPPPPNIRSCPSCSIQ